MTPDTTPTPPPRQFVYDCWTYERREDGVYAAYNRVPTLTFTKLSGSAADPAWYAGMLSILTPQSPPSRTGDTR